MVAASEFWQTCARMQNPADREAATNVSAPPTQSTLPVRSDKPAGHAVPASHTVQQPVEIGGPAGPEPTRFGDWEKKGRCIDF